jgi:hypothetical protein
VPSNDDDVEDPPLLRVVIPNDGDRSRFRCVSNPLTPCESSCGVDDADRSLLLVLSSSHSLAGKTLPEYSNTVPPASVVAANPGILASSLSTTNFSKSPIWG